MKKENEISIKGTVTGQEGGYKVSSIVTLNGNGKDLVLMLMSALEEDEDFKALLSMALTRVATRSFDRMLSEKEEVTES